MSFVVPFDLVIFLLGKFAAAIPVATAAPALIVIAGKKSKRERSKRKGFLMWIAETLHHSRRVQRFRAYSELISGFVQRTTLTPRILSPRCQIRSSNAGAVMQRRSF
jgi:hypothetical protein